MIQGRAGSSNPIRWVRRRRSKPLRPHMERRGELERSKRAERDCSSRSAQIVEAANTFNGVTGIASLPGHDQQR
jgi:hypothetical protein